MNKTAIKRFAIEARKKLMASVSDKAGMLGITEKKCSDPINKGADFEIYMTATGKEVTLNKKQSEQRKILVNQIQERGYEAIIEEVAYTWFNRICAIRFMEVNDYLPSRVRVLSSEKEGKNEPDLVTQAPDVDLDFTDKEKEYIIEAKINNKLDDLFKMLFIKQCNKLHEVLPELFEETEDYTEMLLNISYTNEDDVINMLINKEDGIPEADFNVTIVDENGEVSGQIEIIGWLYQYYNTDLKDDTFSKLKKNIKITKERIPAATQLFTPDWIVRYMVENSVGRLWIEHLRALDSSMAEKVTAEKFGWKYYLPEAEQEADVDLKLAEIRTSYKDLQPADIKCIDPCMGSGHILIAMFDVLMDIYKSVGYSEKDAAFDIVENNIHGLDIDKRAYQLAYFAVMMKGRGYNRRFFRGRDDVKPVPNVYAIMESNDIPKAHLKYFGNSLNQMERNLAVQQIEYLIDVFKDAKEYGSILNVDDCDWNLLRKFGGDLEVGGQISFDSVGTDNSKMEMKRLSNIAEILCRKYDAVVTNPPYMGTNGMSPKLSDFVKKFYVNCKTDMFSIFIRKCSTMVKEDKYYAMITQPSVLFLSSFEKLRRSIIDNSIISSVLHMGRGIFGIDFGSTAFVIRNTRSKSYIGAYFRLHAKTFQYIDPDDISKIYLLSKENENARYNFENYDTKNDGITVNDINPESIKIYYLSNQRDFLKIPGAPIAYWISKSLLNSFEDGEVLKVKGDTRQGMATSDNNRFLRFWYEVELSKLGYGYANAEEAKDSGKKWFPYNKGGQFRKWYGNIDYIINYENDGYEVKEYATELYKTPSRTIKSMSEYFKSCISWSKISSGNIAFRYYPNGFIFDVAGCCVFYKDEDTMYYTFGFLNSKIANNILAAISPTLNYEAGHVASLPVIYNDSYKDEIVTYVKKNINIAKEDWDSYEVSWQFESHPFIKIMNNLKKKDVLLGDIYKYWEDERNNRFNSMKQNEVEINKCFIDIYNLQQDMKSEVDDKDITLRKANKAEDAKSLISYAVGCMFGRYSLLNIGVNNKKQDGDFKVDTDNVIPCTDEEYFSDDIVFKFVDFIKYTFGEMNLEVNLEFIANSISNKKDSSRIIIREYFIRGFMEDHLRIYQKRPIYWMFDSGKQNGFKALIYMHRYCEDTVGIVRTDYLHKAQNYIETSLKTAEYVIDNSSLITEKSKAKKAIDKYTKQLAELKSYDEAIAHIANQRINLDLDDGIKNNYDKFQNIEVTKEGKKAKKIDLLYKI